MRRRRNKHSVFDEPHLRGTSAPRDDSDAKADRTLAREGRGGNEAYRPGASVYDEPDILPGRDGETVAQNWTCRNCGYNLRGLQIENPCPECGRREWYRPPPAGRERFRAWFTQHRQRVSPRRSWLITLLAALVGGPFAIFAALLDGPTGIAAMSLPFVAIIFAPVMEETVKLAIAAYIVDVKPYLFRNERQIMAAAAGSGLVFAAIENAFYLGLYTRTPTVELVLWRWTVCMALHIGCTCIAARGIVGVWRECVDEYRPPRITSAIPALIMAIIVHAAYNAAVLGFEWMY